MSDDTGTDGCPPPPAEVLDAAYGAFSAAVATMDNQLSWLPTGCAGWSVRDLLLHCLEDAQRGPVALHTPAGRPPDRDAVTSWQGLRRDGAVDAIGTRGFVRVSAGLFLRVDQLRDLYPGTAAAVTHAARRASARAPVAPQGHVLSAGDVMRRPAVEATIHHLDLVVGLTGTPGPSAAGHGEVRRTLDGLLGRRVPADWDDTRYARAATGRAPLSDTDRDRLGPMAARFPLLAQPPRTRRIAKLRG
ncbi:MULTISPECIES: maleylpyruvate isomerase N-terminal domain-containing protein [unclassified Streptomyces]|uniref:maleylpyruvate isomerase N-terminal domain-containing protein n=1 Tax=unclassified Streptomyces TaxID=2593676 RepID=UPI0037FAB6ED